MVRSPGRSRLLQVLAAAILATGWPAHLQAQVPPDVADGLVRDTYETIRDEALRPPDLLTLLHQTVLTAERTLVSSGIPDPPPLPPFTGQEDRDLTAAAAYVQAAVTAAPHDADRILAAVLRAMVHAVTDPQGAVYTPLEFVQYQRELRGERPGIGVQVDTVQEQIVITDVTAGGPAGRAGLRAGDALIELDGRPVSGSTPDQVMDRLRGATGTSVAVFVRRGDGGLSRLLLVRETVRENPTRWKMLERHVGYLRLLEFSTGSSRDFRRALAALIEARMEALVLDLRGNGGGLLDEAVSIASAFLKDGPVAHEEQRGTRQPIDVIAGTRLFDGPVVVLVSGFTASASEIVAGALQDAGTPLVGARTFGKATVQTIYPMRGGWGLRLTTARYYTRRGRHIDGAGLQPDLRIPMDDEQIQGPQDVQLREATTVLRARLAAGSGGRP